MQSTTSSLKITDISLYYKLLTNEIFKDFRFVNLMNILIQQQNSEPKYRFAIYSDSSSLSINIFIPIFHTLYLGASNHNVLIFNSDDLWLLDVFPNNNYFLIKEQTDVFDYSKFNIKEISTIKEI